MNATFALSILLVSCNSLALIAPASGGAAEREFNLSGRFPAATSPLSVRGGEDGFSLAELLAALSENTGIVVSATPKSMDLLRQGSTGLIADVEVPAAEAYSFVEAILVANDFLISSIHGGQTPTISVYSASLNPTPSFLRIEVSDLPALSAHAALMVETAITLECADARQFANAMRQMIPDPHLSRVTAMGYSNMLLIRSRVGLVESFIAAARAADQAAANKASASTDG